MFAAKPSRDSDVDFPNGSELRSSQLIETYYKLLLSRLWPVLGRYLLAPLAFQLVLAVRETQKQS